MLLFHSDRIFSSANASAQFFDRDLRQRPVALPACTSHKGSIAYHSDLLAVTVRVARANRVVFCVPVHIGVLTVH